MSNARNLARVIVDTNGDIAANNLDNAVPAEGSITAAKLASTLDLSSKTLSYPDNSISSNDLESGAKPVGVGQTWQGVSRSMGTTYTNTTGRTIFAAAFREGSGANYTYMYAYVDGTTVGHNSAIAGTGYSKPVGLVIPVPNGSTYKFEMSTDGGGSASFSELR